MLPLGGNHRYRYRNRGRNRYRNRCRLFLTGKTDCDCDWDPDSDPDVFVFPHLFSEQIGAHSDHTDTEIGEELEVRQAAGKSSTIGVGKILTLQCRLPIDHNMERIPSFQRVLGLLDQEKFLAVGANRILGLYAVHRDH
jgi:hypothetical protein